MLSDSPELQRVKQVAVVTSVVLSFIGQILIWCTKPALGVEFSHVLVPLLWGFPTLLTLLSCFKSQTTYFYSAFPFSAHAFNSLWMVVMVYQITYNKEYCNDDYDDVACADWGKIVAGAYLLFMLQIVCMIIAALEIKRAYKQLHQRTNVMAPEMPQPHVIYFEQGAPPMGSDAAHPLPPNIPPMTHYMMQPMPGHVVFMPAPPTTPYPPQVPLEEVRL